MMVSYMCWSGRCVTEGISSCWGPVLINFTCFGMMVSRCVEQEGGESDVNVEHEQHADVTVLIVSRPREIMMNIQQW